MLELTQLRIGMAGKVRTGKEQFIVPDVELTFAVLKEENWDEAIQRACNMTHDALMLSARRMLINVDDRLKNDLLIQLGDTATVIIEVLDPPDGWEAKTEPINTPTPDWLNELVEKEEDKPVSREDWLKKQLSPPLVPDPKDSIGFDA